ncbi:adenylate kinase [Antrihabitans cavernicola]|uniref:Adenylate kinase n=1 Tax=Antrihabitans cavernicola TaxID=2495913 RepID=A0A5A7S0L1_9NOCA|nr:adenylate kinase [Spelaeibacter cavernicola]KAA0016075.1 adenylate kinase [Spelaeibacter cavernicola]
MTASYELFVQSLAHRATDVRIVVAGISGVGKSTLAGEISRKIDVEVVELDALHHGPNWQPRLTFQSEAMALIGRPSWIVDSSGYPQITDALWERATHIIWLDLPRHVVFWRLAIRSIARTARRTELWNGNRESLRQWFTADHPLWTAMRRYDGRRKFVSEHIGAKRTPFDLAHITSRRAGNDFSAQLDYELEFGQRVD